MGVTVLADQDSPTLGEQTPGEQDAHWMGQALQLARYAEQQGEIPVGAVLVRDGVVIGEGWNSNISQNDPSAHAEIMAIRNAGLAARNHRLPGSILYVTLEPCCMCAGAIIHARLEQVVFGADDPKTGAAGGCFEVLGDDRHNHLVSVRGGCRASECSKLLKAFFRAKRRE